eukprot:m.53536 g.53536  ORF g.53536 m.53536 type:complete len:235 (+) comp6773_c0_seq2:14-718(+)
MHVVLAGRILGARHILSGHSPQAARKAAILSLQLSAVQPPAPAGGDLMAAMPDEPCQDGRYFKRQLGTVIRRLEGLIAAYEADLATGELGEDAQGRVRRAIGQAQLLISKRLPQFDGLCDLNLDPAAKKRATNSDLAGFWDLISLPISDVMGMFDELAAIKANGWEVPKPPPTPAKKTPTRSPRPTKPRKSAPAAVANPALAAARRKALQEKREALKRAHGKDDSHCEIIFVTK